MKKYFPHFIILFLIIFSVSTGFSQVHINSEADEQAQKENQLGKKSWQDQDFESALKHFTKAAGLDSGNDKYFANAGVSASYLGKKQEAVNWFKQAVDIAVQKKIFQNIKQYNSQIDAILNTWPVWAEKIMEDASILPDTPEMMQAQQKWYELTEQAGHLNDEDAISLINKAIEIAKINFGETHIATLNSIKALAEIHYSLKQYKKAESLYLTALESSKELLGEMHPETLDTMLSLALVYNDAGAYIKAQDILESTLIFYEEKLGKEFPETLNCMKYLAVVYIKQNLYDKAELLYKEVLELNQKIFGKKHPASLNIMKDLADLYRRKSKYELAEELLLNTLSYFKEILGDESYDTYAVMDCLAKLYEDTGHYDEAESLFQRVYLYQVQTLGKKHLDTITSLSNLGSIYRRQGFFWEAEDSFSKAFNLMREIRGEKNPATIELMNNLALIYEDQGLYEKAGPLFKKALRFSQEVLGENNKSTLAIMNNLALLYESQGVFLRAEPLYKTTINLSEKLLGKEHPDTLASINNLAYLYMLEQDYESAEPLFIKVLDLWEKTLGNKHQNTLKALNNLARVYHRLGLYNKAERLFLKALKLRKEVLGPQHIDTIRTMNDLAVLYYSQKKYDQAEDLLIETLKLEEKNLGANHPYTFESLNNMADLKEAQKNIRQAFSLRKEIFKRRNKVFNRLLWAAGENARHGYIRLHKKEQDEFISLLAKMNTPESAREIMNISLERKGVLLRISSEIQQVINMSDIPALKGISQNLIKKKKELASLTLSGPVDVKPEQYLKTMKELEDEIEEYQGELGRASLLFRKSIRPVTPENAVDSLNNEAIIDFITYKEKTTGIIKLIATIGQKDNTGKCIINLVNLGELEAIRSGVENYRAIIQDEDAEDEEVIEEGQILYDQIWKPLLPYLNEKTSVFIVPDSILNILPFDALVDNNGYYLIQNHELKILSSGRNLVLSSLPPAKGSYFIVAGPDYDADYLKNIKINKNIKNKRASGLNEGLRMAAAGMRGLSFDPLPGAEKEGIQIEAICKKTKKTILFSGQKGEERQLRELKISPDVLHIATHGFFLKSDENLTRRLLKIQRSGAVGLPPPGDNPLLRAGLAFAGINNNARFLGEIDTDNDGVLTALEVLGLNLNGTRLVVLSACETGIGEIHDGEGVYGLRRAFQEAGVNCVINSLWEVSDEGTQALMTALYKGLLSGLSTRQAFKQAQLELLESDKWNYPYIWSAFVIVVK
ncbi:TPR repeat-containing protein [Candidatus Magnetomoraceae bacterium gMMP-15]